MNSPSQAELEKLCLENGIDIAEAMDFSSHAKVLPWFEIEKFAQLLLQREGSCDYCGDSGDIHRPDGEWMGVCDCPAGKAIEARATSNHTEEPLAMVNDDGYEQFSQYIAANYKGDINFHNPDWHAVRIWRAAKHAMKAQQPTAQGGEVEILHAALERLTRLYESEQDFENVWSLRPDWLRNALDIKPSTAKEPQ